jgi:hypothetical protein
MFSLLVSWLGVKSEPASLTFTQEASSQERDRGRGNLAAADITKELRR